MAFNFDNAVQALMKDINLSVEKGLKSAAPDLDSLAVQTKSSTAASVYPFLGSFPQLEEWVGPRQAKSMKNHAFTIPNKKWETTIEIDRDAIEDDLTHATSLAMMQGELAGETVRLQMTEMIAGMLKDGETTACYDGQYFFDVDHPLYPNHDGTGSAVNQGNYQAGAEMPWYLFDLSRSALKPFIFQMRQATRFDALTQTHQSEVFKTDKIQVGLSRRCNAGYAFWQFAFKSKETLSEANLWAAIASMRTLKKDGGKPIGIRPTHLLVPPALEKTARQLMEMPMNASGASNVNATLGVQVMVSPYI